MGSQSNIAPPPDRSLTVFAFVILIAGGAAIWFLRPALFGGHEPTPAPAPVAASAAPPLAARCRASLTVTDAPVNAEILVRAGQAPVDVEKMPVGARLEFVATAEGYAPKRAVVPSGASWDTGPTENRGTRWRCSSIAPMRAPARWTLGRRASPGPRLEEKVPRGRFTS